VFYLFYIDHTSLFSSHEKEVYDNLVGCKMDIRIRQNMFLIKDKIYNKANAQKTQESSESLAEGLDLPGRDFDIMLLLTGLRVLYNVQHMNL